MSPLPGVTLMKKARIAFFTYLAAKRESNLLKRLHSADGPTGARCIAYIGSAGLANRLRAHVISSVYAERTGRTLIPGWVVNEHLGCEFSDLFESDSPKGINFQSVRQVTYVRPLSSFQGDVSDYPEEMVFFKTQWQDLTSEYLLRAAKPYCGNFGKWFKPRSEISAFVDHCVAQWPQSVLGVHVRRGDFVPQDQDLPESRYNAAISRALAELPDTTRILLVSDAPPEDLRAIENAFPGRVMPPIMKPEGFLGARGTLSEARGALVDMLLLSRTSMLILTPGSTFGEFAGFISNIPAVFA